MIRTAAVVLAVLATSAPARAWNDKGHMVVARLAWKELAPAERAKVVELLSTHPHAAEFLKSDRPAGFAEDEWMFLRAGTWADWVRGGPPDRKAYHEGPSHYVNVPIVAAGYALTPPPAPPVTVVTRIKSARAGAVSGSDRVKRAVELTWLFHLVGDVHQPLHCATLFSERFPEGDRGGNKSLARLDGRTIQLHSFWDGLMGKGVSAGEIGATVAEVEALWAEAAPPLRAEAESHGTVESWVDEGYVLAKRHVYLDGALKPADAEANPPMASIPPVPADYGENGGQVARLAAARAGKRLAAVLREVAAAN